MGGHKKLKLGSVASYEIWPGNGDGIFWFWCFTDLSLTYLGTYPLTYSPGTHTGHKITLLHAQCTSKLIFIHNI